jgi:hypothetical protein
VFMHSLRAHDTPTTCAGEVVLYNWIELLTERWAEITAELHPKPEAGGGDANRDTVGGTLSEEGLQGGGLGAAFHALTLADKEAVAAGEDAAALAAGLGIVHGEPFTEKRSTFQAHLAAVSSTVEVGAVMTCLLSNNKIRSATHNMMAYRIEQPQAGTFVQVRALHAAVVHGRLPGMLADLPVLLPFTWPFAGKGSQACAWHE